MNIEPIKYKYLFWRVKYKDEIYCREIKNRAIYWSIENIGQNRELYKIQHKLEIVFNRTIRKTIRKDKIQNINESRRNL